MRNVSVWLVGFVAFGALSTLGFGEEVVSKIEGLSAWYRADRVAQGPDNALTSLIDGSGNGRDLVIAARTFHAFDQWVVNGNATVDDPRQPSAILTMPSRDVSVTAIYRRNSE